MAYPILNSGEGTAPSNNADFGISLQSMLCDRAGVYVNHTAAEHFRSNYNDRYDKELLTICKRIEGILPSKIKEYLTTVFDLDQSTNISSGRWIRTTDLQFMRLAS